MKKQVPFLIRLTRFLAGFKLTPVGRIAVLGIFTSAIGGVTVEIPIYQIFCGLVCLFGVIEATGILLRPKLDVSAWLPEKVTVGESVTGYITVKNLGWLPACDIMCALFGMPKGIKHIDADRSIRTIPSSEQATLPLTILADQRGDYVLPEARIHSTFPFNLMRFGKARTPEREIRVLPKFAPLENLALPFSQKMVGGEFTLDARVGDSPEFMGNRDYIPGEPVRKLDFKAWARVGRPVVREYQDERNSDVAIILDTYQPKRWRMRRKDREQLEAAVSVTAAIAHRLTEDDSVIEAFMAGADFYLFDSSATMPHFDSVVDILSEVEFVRHDPLPQITPVLSESLERVAVAVCVFIDWDESRAEFLREIFAAGCQVKLLIVNEGELSSPIESDAVEFQVLAPQDILTGMVRTL